MLLLQLCVAVVLQLLQFAFQLAGHHVVPNLDHVPAVEAAAYDADQSRQLHGQIWQAVLLHLEQQILLRPTAV